MKITIVGMGALGVLFGDRITAALGKETVTFLADKERIERYEREGVYCNGKRCDFQMTDKAYPADLLMFAVKGTALEEAAQLAKEAVGENTIILSLLNGISSEEALSQYLEKGHIVHCIAQGMDAVKLGNKLTYSHTGELRIGTPKAADQPFVEQTARMLRQADVPYVIEEDIMHRLWGKWMLNVGVNQVVMISEGTYRTVQQPGKERELMRSAMEEVLMLSEKAGTGVTRQDLEDYIALVDTLNPEGMPSMRQDGLARRYSEVELFAGTVIRKGEQYGVPVPVNRMLYDRIKEIEAAY